MKTKTAILVATMALLLQAVAFAKPKPKIQTYPVACSTAWEAAKTAVQEHYDVLNLNDQTQSGSFTTGSIWSGVRPIAFSLRPGTGETCTVSVTGHFSGLIHNDKGDFFNRIQEVLNRQVQATTQPQAPAAAKSASPAKPAPPAMSAVDENGRVRQ